MAKVDDDILNEYEKHKELPDEAAVEEDVLDSLINTNDNTDDEDEHLKIGLSFDDEEKVLTDDEKLHQEKIERVKKRISLEGKMERKSTLDHNLIEENVKNFLDKYDLENRINDYSQSIISVFQNENTELDIIENVETGKEYQWKDVVIFEIFQAFQVD
jgi:hypothetical protein